MSGESPSGNTKKTWEARLGGETCVSPERTREWYKAHAPEKWREAKAAAAAAAAAEAAAGAGGGGAGAKGAPAAPPGGGGTGCGLQFSIDAGEGAAAAAPPPPPPPPPKAAPKLPLVTTLDFFFPPGTPQRELLEGLVGAPAPRGGAGGGGGGGGGGGAAGAEKQQRHRFSAAQALAWFAESPWRDMRTPADV